MARYAVERIGTERLGVAWPRLEGAVVHGVAWSASVRFGKVRLALVRSGWLWLGAVSLGDITN